MNSAFLTAARILVSTAFWSALRAGESSSFLVSAAKKAAQQSRRGQRQAHADAGMHASKVQPGVGNGSRGCRRTISRLLDGSLSLGEVGVVELGHVNPGGVNLGAGRDDEGLIDTADRNAVDLVGAGHEEQARGELLEENNPLAPETTREEDENSPRGDALPKLGGLGNVAPEGREGGQRYFQVRATVH